jgi:hypothetical protein
MRNANSVQSECAMSRLLVEDTDLLRQAHCPVLKASLDGPRWYPSFGAPADPHGVENQNPSTFDARRMRTRRNGLVSSGNCTPIRSL